MKAVITLTLIQLLAIGDLVSCGCGGPKNLLETDIDSSDAIFVGIISSINADHLFHLNNGIGTGLKYVNFDVFRSHKGLNKAQLKITVFDSASNTSCEGLLYGKKIGDTILCFADEIDPQMLGSYMCGRHPNLNDLSNEEQNFLDTATLTDPRTLYDDADSYLEDIFESPGVEPDIGPQVQRICIDFVLYLTVAVNLIRALAFLWKNVRGHTAIKNPIEP